MSALFTFFMVVMEPNLASKQVCDTCSSGTSLFSWEVLDLHDRNLGGRQFCESVLCGWNLDG